MKHFITALLALTLMSLVGAEIPQDVKVPSGAYGVFQCPALGTSTPCYYSDFYGVEILNRENCALLRRLGEGYAVLDHADSEVDGGIWNVNEMQVGGAAFMIKADKTKRYECTAIFLCYFDGFKYISDFDSRNVKPREKGDLICVSCAVPDGSMAYVAYYKFVGVEPE